MCISSDLFIWSVVFVLVSLSALLFVRAYWTNRPEMNESDRILFERSHYRTKELPEVPNEYYHQHRKSTEVHLWPGDKR